jgi:bifunctional UDP-N-acetylglucosamine pyrophosphorylase/glucosamine-1-phosphate N-acetyltransferase
MVRDYFGDGKRWGVSIDYVNQGKPMGTGHAIGCVERFVDDLIVICGDTIFGEKDFKNILESEQSMGLLEVNDPKNYGVVKLEDDKIIKIFEKMEKPFSNLINGGIYHFKHNIFYYIKKTQKSPRGEYEITDTINLIARNHEFIGINIEEWRDVVYPWHLLDANIDILKSLNSKILGKIEDNTTIKGKLYVGENTVVMSGSYIEGPVIIGNNCKIGPNCYIRPYTSIGESCHVGNACEIKNSIIMNKSSIPHHNYMGDSVLGENCNLGSGTKIANLRMDKKNIKVISNGLKIDSSRRKLGVIMGDNVQTGVNSVIDVGSMIGNNVFIGPGSIVKGEILQNSQIL